MQLSDHDVLITYQAVLNKYQNTSRFNHILGVLNKSKDIASKYNVDVNKVSVAALLHDYYKYESFEEMKKYIYEEDRLECEEFPFLYHAYCSAKALYEEFNIHDEDIYNSIRNHVVGRPNMSILEKIIFISDYTEDGRIYENCRIVRDILSSKGIDEAIYYATLYTTKLYNKMHKNQKYILENKEKI